MEHLRISAISYLNTAPLMWDFEHGHGGGFDIAYTVPSRCAAQLAEGTADIGIIPAAAYTTIPNLLVLPGISIASRRHVRSILLISKVPREEIATVALDTASMTSVALTKILFQKWGSQPKFITKDSILQQMLRDCDAGLLIGDPALQVDRTRLYTYDLAEEWNRLTGKAFVFAFWAVRRDAIEKLRSPADLSETFLRSRDHGLEAASLEEIARDWAPRIGLREAEIVEYLTKNIYYQLDDPCLEGLNLFYQYARECGCLPSAPSLRFVDSGEQELAKFERNNMQNVNRV